METVNMETVSNDNPSDCQAAAADSTTMAVDENSTVVDAAGTIALAMTGEEVQQQVSSTTASSQAVAAATTMALSAPANNSSTPPQSSNINNNNGNNNNKLKSQQQQQQQQQQQYHQFRAPQQFVRHKKSTSSITKKNKTWNKRQNKTTKQQQNFTISAAPGAGGTAVIGGGCQVIGGGGGSIINSAGASVGVGSSASGSTLPTTKADLENIQNFKNQLGVGGGNHHYYHNHHGHHGNGLPSSSLVGGVEKLGYGHGHLKQQLYKKMLMHRGHHHHVLCAGAAHNTVGGGANVSCCLINGCSGQNVKDNSSGVGGCGVSAVTNSNTTGASNTLHFCCGRSKFFLPGNRLRKEAIIPPTKFLLGGNISDPLNLNSLQNETSNASSNSNTPATTPRQSPITTPPKVEVIIPPNIHDPLHLLDPVDSMEYEKQLTSPMKRGGPRGSNKQHHKHHRHRKNRKPKRRRYESFTSTSTTGALEITDDTSSLANSTISTEASSSALSISLLDSSGVGVGGISSVSNSAIAPTAAVEFRAQECDDRVLSPSLLTTVECPERNALLLSPQGGALPQQHALNSTMVAVGERDAIVVVSDATLPRERERQRAIRDLRLDLNSTTSSTCGGAIGNLSGSILYGNAAGGGGGGRKRKISESNNSQKNKKFHRLDSMDKIVSPVVPQPGAWKRPPRVVPSGARKTSTRRSTSVSESELLSPGDDVSKTLQPEVETLRLDTPDLNKVETISEIGLGTPVILDSAATSAAAGEHKIVTDINVGDSSTTAVVIAADVSSNKAADESALSTTTATTTTTITNSVKQLVKIPKFRADGAKYRYGNYDRYTGFRHLNEFMDVRLQVFQRHLELFQNKDILDIGCNVGHMTVTVARNLAPKSILGIDIDKELITRARRNLALYVRIPHDPIKKEDTPVVGGGVKAEESTHIAGRATETRIPNVLSFIQFNKKFKKKVPRKYKQCSQDPIVHHSHYQHHRLLHHYHSHHHYQMHQQHLQKQQQLKLHVPASELFPVSFPLTYGGIPTAQPHHFGGELTSPVYTSTSTPGNPSNASATPSNHTNYSSTKSKNDFPRNVFFRQTNYVLKDESQLCNDTQQYDLIMCLSVTKWIHLNFGDAGLKLAFKRMFNQLRPGGKLILEAQNWASYKKKKNLTEEIYNNYRNIEFFPNKFHEYLLSSDVGFSHSYTLGVPRHLSKGFCRPIQLYAKGDYTPNHVRWSDAYYPQTPYEAYRGIYATMPPRPAGMASYAMSSTRSQTYDTPHYTGGTSGSYSCRQTPMHPLTSQYYNPLETDSYLPSYDMEYLNHMYVFASPLYQTVWSPPASLRNSSSHTPVFGSVRDAELDGDGIHRHVYPPNDDTSSPNANAGGAFSSIRDADTDDSNQMPASNVQHVYATNCGESSSSPQVHHHDSETIDGLMLDEEPNGAGAAAATVTGGGSSVAGACCDLNNE